MSKEAKIMKTVARQFDGGLKCKHRSRLQDIRREFVYDDIISRIGNSIFKWDGLPDEFLQSCNSMLIELAVNCGCAVLYKIPESISISNGGKWTCTPVEWTGQTRNDGTSEHFITYGTDYSITDSQLTDYVIIKNDSYMSCEYDVTEWYGSMLADTDISERALIRWSRMTPIARANGGAEIGQIEEVMKKVYDGIPWAVIDDKTKMITGQPMSRDDSVLRLTDESAIERMHFLSEFHYELVRRLCNLYNMPFHTTAKSAQNLESEIHNTDIFSQALTPDRLSERKKAAEKINSVFGWDVTVSTGETIKKEDEVIDSNVKQEIIEGNGGNVSHETIPNDGKTGGETDD